MTLADIQTVEETITPKWSIHALPSQEPSNVQRLVRKPHTPIDHFDAPADGAQFGHAVLLTTIEVLTGHRSVKQLTRWFTPAAFEGIRQYSMLRLRRSPNQTSGRRPVLMRVRTCSPNDTCMEIAGVVHDGKRIRAATLRLIRHRDRWRVSDFALL